MMPSTEIAPKPSPSVATKPGFDVQKVRQDFPALHQEIKGKPLVYLDNAASAQTPQAVIDAIVGFYQRDYANIHRGVHTLSQRATQAYEDARHKIQRYLNAERPEEIVFTRGTTEAINLVAASYGGAHLREGDEVLISALEHHSNIVPWQIVCEKVGAHLKVIPIDDTGAFSADDVAQLLNDKTRIVAMGHVSNALGTINPVREVIALAHERGIPVLLDGAQAAPHMRVDVRELDVDFYALSGHKLFGPTGVGVLYGKYDLLAEMPPYEGGGDMIRTVTFEQSTYAAPPSRFEAGTPHIAGGIGLGAAVEYLEALDFEAIAAHENALLKAATEKLQQFEKLRLIGTAKHKASVVSFVIEGIHPHDIGTILDMEGIAIRAGHHCAEPIMTRFGVSATARASFAFYNTLDEVDALVRGIEKTLDLFG